jgi:hypothetical protein
MYRHVFARSFSLCSLRDTCRLFSNISSCMHGKSTLLETDPIKYELGFFEVGFSRRKGGTEPSQSLTSVQGCGNDTVQRQSPGVEGVKSEKKERGRKEKEEEGEKWKRRGIRKG